MDRGAEPAALVRGVAETPARIEVAARPLSAEQLRAPPAAGEWSLNEILWHVRTTADVHSEHIARILGEDTPQWRHVSPRARMKKSRYDQLPFAESFAEFARQRAELVAQLEGLAPEAWHRIALVYVPHRGDEWRVTLRQLVWGLADHEEGHCAQFEQVSAGFSQTADDPGSG